MHPFIEVCRKCEGTGRLIEFPIWDVLKQTEAEIKICELCEGSGRVIVSKKIEITVVAFKADI